MADGHVPEGSGGLDGAVPIVGVLLGDVEDLHSSSLEWSCVADVLQTEDVLHSSLEWMWVAAVLGDEERRRLARGTHSSGQVELDCRVVVARVAGVLRGVGDVEDGLEGVRVDPVGRQLSIPERNRGLRRQNKRIRQRL